ncbi:hypothetical protein EYF80_055266 [Liparis tanakae]|uniref:Uncharacterized protein n=1 Tax=Liparis tanakae TaxID=230148 RepID=A0A4Z2F1D1_9TELE|nr:hypothetical protein EYF80_055266 [Liparis tanakae]
MASQPTIIAMPPTGAILRRPGSPVMAWWYREPQNIPMPATRRVPAWLCWELNVMEPGHTRQTAPVITERGVGTGR